MGGTDSAELYDPATGKFTVIAKMTIPRGRPSATLLTNGDVLIAGGERRDNESLASAEIFHVKTLSFQPTGSMHHARISHTATLLQDGRVLIAGGYADGVESGAELYDPKNGTFTETGSLKTARCKHTAGLLSDGRVLVAGGSDSRGWNGNLNSAEIYDPRTAKFTVAAAMNDSRFKLPDEAVQLPSGKLLIAGGSKQVEVFDSGQREVPGSGRANGRTLAFHVGNQAPRRQRALGGRISEQSRSDLPDLDLPSLTDPRHGHTEARKWLNLAKMAEMSHPGSCNFSADSAFK